MAPSTFASAAASSNSNLQRTDSGGEWSRRPNGATQTFRRSSHAATPSNTSITRESSGANTATSINPGVYVPPHVHASRNGASGESRYSKDQLLQLFRSQKDDESLGDGLPELYVAGWEPNIANGVSNPSWGRRDDYGRESQPGADVCWDKDGVIAPLNLSSMTDQEKELFAGSVNSPLKPPAQNQAKEGNAKDGLSLRKSSVSYQTQNSPGPFGLASPTGARSGNRRREPSDAFPFPSTSLASPSTTRITREESAAVTPPPSLTRRRTDFKEPNQADEGDKDKAREPTLDTSGPFGSLKRTTTGPFSAGITGPTSPWTTASPSATFSPMGSFGNFALGNNASQSTNTEKRPGFGSLRGESRFKGLMSKNSSEDVKGIKEKSSTGTLGKLGEGTSQSTWLEGRPKRPTSDDSDPFPDDDLRTGSAALGGGEDVSPQRQILQQLGTPRRQVSREEPGFSAFGMTSDTGLRDVFHARDGLQHQTPHSRQGAGPAEPMSPTDTNPYQSPDHERTEQEDLGADESTLHGAHLPGLGGFNTDQNTSHVPGSFATLSGLGRPPVSLEAAQSDRSQTSSAGPNRQFPGLGGFGGLPGLGSSSAWPSGQGTIGTPIREKQSFGGGFGDSMFGSVADLQSPNFGGLGGSGTFGSAGRSKMGSLFPVAMQEQMRTNEPPRPNDDGANEGERQSVGTGSFTRVPFGGSTFNNPGPNRETESPFRSGRGAFEDVLSGIEGRPGRGSDDLSNESMSAAFNSQLQTSANPSNPVSIQGNVGQRNVNQNAQPQSQSVSSSASNQPPAAQQRTMVMPDRMRWIYRDPQGNTQGPWSGLEMHDWYKAGFFSPELLVKKAEDPDYEPLAQLIRRIGNSREPFLVPQIGIPHGPPANQAGNTWAGSAIPSAGGAQPPFANSFPSFGTTLTAEQQNALERRKQEEQYLMARQKEHLAQQQVLARQAHMQSQPGILPHQLQHHSSAHSLQSQPSFGSITSPGGFQPPPQQAPMPSNPAAPGYFDNSFRSSAQATPLAPMGGAMDMLGHIREEDMPGMFERLNMGRGPGGPFSGGPAGPFGQQMHQEPNAQQIASMMSDRARLQREQAEHDTMQQNSETMEQQAAQDTANRLQQFHDLREDTTDRMLMTAANEDQTGDTNRRQEEIQEQPNQGLRVEPPTFQGQQVEPQLISKPSEPLSLTEQVQKAASAKQSSTPQSPWGKMETSLPQPFPPPPSSSPLPAPAAQRKQNLADALTAESRSHSATPSIETPSASIAPWAKEVTETAKGPSLREIQEAEAKKAAQKEELAAAVRRAAFEKELLAQATAPAPAPGLPSSSTWGSTASPVTPSSATIAWAKPLAGKSSAPSSATTKKTVQQIMREEEARKQRAATTAASAPGIASQNSQGLSSGKRYADLAGKQIPTAPANATAVGGGAWTTVGASGKVKSPSTSAPNGPSGGARSLSTGIGAAAPKAKPSGQPPPTRNAIMGVSAGPVPVSAQDEFKKWAVAELRGDLAKGMNAEEIVSGLLSCPPELDLVTEAVHSVSQTIDSRHFAEEFLRRRKLADKGVVDPAPTSQSGHHAPPASAEAGGPTGRGGGGAGSGSAGSGGWSEVAKKGQSNATATPKDENGVGGPNFKVVAAKKKGRR